MIKLDSLSTVSKFIYIRMNQILLLSIDYTIQIKQSIKKTISTILKLLALIEIKIFVIYLFLFAKFF